MYISDKQFKKVIVQTLSKDRLGKLAGFELDTDTGVIEKYYVKSQIYLPGILESTLIINKNQVISFDDKVMVVEDSVVKNKVEAESNLAPGKIEGPEPVITSKNSIS